MDRIEAIDRLCRRVYMGVRDDAPDSTDCFDLAAAVLGSKPADQDAAELASLSLETAAADPPRMTRLAKTVLAVACRELGLSEEPGLLERLDDAMRLVNRDLAASGLPHTCRLRFPDHDEQFGGYLFAQSWDGTSSTSSGVSSRAGADPVSALLAVADDAQDAVVHTIWSAWPVCPVHRVGTDPREHGSAVVWWCGGGGHVAAAVGEWPDR
jgi:hypothetical protein